MNVLSRLLAFALGLALAVAAVVGIAEIVAGLVGRPPLAIPRASWHRSLEGLRWDEPVLVAFAVGMIVVGALLVATQLVPRRPRELALASTDPARRAAVDRRGLQHRLRHVAAQDPDVVDARARVRRKVKVSADVLARGDRTAIRGRLRETLEQELAAMRLERTLKVAVTVRRAQERVR